MPCFAAIDVGSSAIRLSITRVSPLGVIIDTAYHRYGMRLGADVFASGTIRAPQVRALVDVFRDIQRILGEHHVDQFRAVATSAMRDAKNGPAVVTAIRKATGIEVEIISGLEEGRLSRDALCRALGSVADDTLLVDLGGGSLQLYRAGGGLSRSLPLGTVRLIRSHPQMLRALTPREVKALAHGVERDLKRYVRPRRIPLAIGTGGNLDVLARLIPADAHFYPGIDVRALAQGAVRLASVGPAERIERFEIRPDRADIIIPSVLTILAVCRVFGVEHFLVPGTGLRDGTVQRLAEAAAVKPPIKALRKRFGLKPTLTADAVAMSERLFNLFKPVHHLYPQARVVLSTAAALMDLGSSIDPIAPEAHSAYIIQNLAGMGLDSRSQAVAAYLAARCTGDGVPTFIDILPAELEPAEKLVALLRAARALVALSAKLPHIEFADQHVTLVTGVGRHFPHGITEALAAAFHTRVSVR